MIFSLVCFVDFSLGIYITFVGNAECLWSENSGDKRIAYRGKECYLSTRTYFIGQENGKLNVNAEIRLLIFSDFIQVNR